MLLDIILCCYQSNLEHLRRSIDSVLCQTYGNWMLYVVLDGRQPYISEFLEKYSYNTKIIIYENEENKGLPLSLNIGHSLGYGDFISWTSDDNYYDLSFVKCMTETIRDCLAQQGDCRYLRSLEKHFHSTDCKSIVFDPQHGDSCLGKGNILYPGYLGASHLYSRSAYEDTAGYDPNLSGIEDLDMYYQFRSKGIDPVFVPEVLYNYRVGKSRFNPDKIREAREKFLKKWNKNANIG